MNITVLGCRCLGHGNCDKPCLATFRCFVGKEKQCHCRCRQHPPEQGGVARFCIAGSLAADCRFRKSGCPCIRRGWLAIVATSVAGLREVAGNLRNSGIANLIWLCKGFEENTGLMPSQVVSEVTANRLNTGVLSGPSFAQEVAAGLPCALTIASKSSALRQRVTDAINGGNMRIYSSDESQGVEVGGAVKNILAIATGMSDGLALGMNARAALITRGSRK